MKYTFIILLFTTYSFAQKKDSLTKQSFILSSFNDSWGGGLTQIRDDYRSFGIAAEYLLDEKLKVNFQFSGLTNKHAQTPSRLDELILTTQFALKKNLLNSLNLFGIIGVFDLNNSGGEFIQNGTHQQFGVAKVSIPYSDYRKTFFQVGTFINTNKKVLHSYLSSSLILQPSVELFIVPDYFATVKAQIPFQYISSKGFLLSLSPGYQYSNINTSNKLLQTITSIETGPTLEYKLQAGFISMNWKLFLNSNFSLGTYGINILLQNKKEHFKTSDLTIETGALVDGNGFYTKYLWNKLNVLPSHFNFVAYNQFGTYLKKRLANYPKLYGHYQQFSLGFELSALKNESNFPIIPYIGIQAGLKRQLSYSGTEWNKNKIEFTPFAFTEIGLKLKPFAAQYYKNTRRGFSLHYKYLQSLFFNEKRGFNTSNNLPNSLGYFGVGLFVNVDL